jgi:hypothetical protein
LPILPRSDSTAEFQPLEDKEVEYFFASDASAVIEHTNRVIFLEVSQTSEYKSQILNLKEFIPSCAGSSKLYSLYVIGYLLLSLT